MATASGAPTGEACPICHREVKADEAFEWAPVCPLIYPEVEGLRCHAECLAAERERNRFLRREDLAPTFLRFRSASSSDTRTEQRRTANGKDREP